MLTLKGAQWANQQVFLEQPAVLHWDFSQMSLGASTHTSWTEWLCQLSNELQQQ